MCKYRDYSISLKAVTAIPAFINFIVSKPMALPYVIWAGHLHGLDHGIILNSLKYMEQCVKGYMVPPDHRLFHSCPKHSGGL